MPTAYPLKIRDGVRRAKAQGMPTKQVAELFGVSRSWSDASYNAPGMTDKLNPSPAAASAAVRSMMTS